MLMNSHAIAGSNKIFVLTIIFSPFFHHFFFNEISGSCDYKAETKLKQPFRVLVHWMFYSIELRGGSGSYSTIEWELTRKAKIGKTSFDENYLGRNVCSKVNFRLRCWRETSRSDLRVILTCKDAEQLSFCNLQRTIAITMDKKKRKEIYDWRANY